MAMAYMRPGQTTADGGMGAGGVGGMIGKSTVAPKAAAAPVQPMIAQPQPAPVKPSVANPTAQPLVQPPMAMPNSNGSVAPVGGAEMTAHTMPVVTDYTPRPAATPAPAANPVPSWLQNTIGVTNPGAQGGATYGQQLQTQAAQGNTGAAGALSGLQSQAAQGNAGAARVLTGTEGGPPIVQPRIGAMATQPPTLTRQPFQPPTTMGETDLSRQTAQNWNGLVDFGPGDDLRSTQINPQASQRLRDTQGNVDTSRQNVMNDAGLPAWRDINAYVDPYRAQADADAGSARGAYAQAQLGNFNSVGPLDTTGATMAYGRSQNAIGGASIGNYGALSPLDTAGARSAYGQAASELGNAQMTERGALGTTDQTAAQGLMGEAATAARGGALSPYAGIGAGTYADSGDATRARQLASQGLESMYGGPDRQQLALQTLRLAQEQAEPAYQQRLQDIGRKAAALGRVGAGMTTNEIGDLELARQREQNQLARQVSLDTAGQMMSDRQSQLQAAQGLAGQLQGQDLAGANFQQGLRQEGRTERDAVRNAQLAEQNLGLQRSSALSGLAGQQYGMGQAQRAELAGERDFASQQDAARANIALQRSQQQQNLGAAQLGMSQAQQSDLANERTFQADLAGQRANLALNRAGAEQSLGNSLLGMSQAQRDALSQDQQFQANLANQRANLNLSRGNALAGLAQQEFGQGQTLQAADRTERNAQQDYAQQRLAMNQQILNQMMGLEGQTYGQEQSSRNELRSERDYQTGAAQQALENRIRQLQLEEAMKSDAFSRDMQRANLQLQGANMASDNASGAQGSAADLIQQLALLNALRTGQNQQGNGG